jgi:uncharacterized protein
MDAKQITPPETQNFAIVAGAFEGGLAILALILGWMFGIDTMATFHWAWIDVCWGIVATLPLLVIFGFLLFLSWEPFRKIRRFLNQSVLPLFRQCGILEIAVIALLAGLGEELIFRSIIQYGLARQMSSPYGMILGLAVATVVFAFCHFVTFTYAILAGAIGLYLGILWLLTGNLLAPIIVHSLYDFIAILILLRMPTRLENRTIE